MGWGYGNLGGGVGLNFDVKSYATEADMLMAAPKKNAIGIITTTKITSYVFSASEPAEPAEGMAWVATGGKTVAQINALKKNGILLNVGICKQYTSGMWVKRDAWIWRGEWIELTSYLFKRGVVYDELTGGINGTIRDDSLYVTGTIQASYNKTYTTLKKVDLTDAKTIRIIARSSNQSANAYFRVTVTTRTYNGGRATTDDLTAYGGGSGPFDGAETEYSVDVSGLTGEYYLGYCWGVSSSGSSSVNVTGQVLEWWVE